MKQKILFSLWALTLMVLSVSAQTEKERITGIVIDYTSEEPLPGATIFIEELKKGDVADKHGEFSFSEVPFGTYTLTVKFMGYQKATQKVTVSNERAKKTIIRLKAEAQLLDEVVVMGKSEARKIRDKDWPANPKTSHARIGHQHETAARDSERYTRYIGKDRRGCHSFYRRGGQHFPIVCTWPRG